MTNPHELGEFVLAEIAAHPAETRQWFLGQVLSIIENRYCLACHVDSADCICFHDDWC